MRPPDDRIVLRVSHETHPWSSASDGSPTGPECEDSDAGVARRLAVGRRQSRERVRKPFQPAAPCRARRARAQPFLLESLRRRQDELNVVSVQARDRGRHTGGAAHPRESVERCGSQFGSLSRARRDASSCVAGELGHRRPRPHLPDSWCSASSSASYRPLPAQTSRPPRDACARSCHGRSGESGSASSLPTIAVGRAPPRGHRRQELRRSMAAMTT